MDMKTNVTYIFTCICSREINITRLSMAEKTKPTYQKIKICYIQIFYLDPHQVVHTQTTKYARLK